MDRARIKEWLEMQVLNVCLASLSRKEGDLASAINDLHARVELLVKQTVREDRQHHAATN